MKYIIKGINIQSSYSRSGEDLFIPVQIVVGINGAVQNEWGSGEYICNVTYPATIKETPEDIEIAIPVWSEAWVKANFPQ